MLNATDQKGATGGFRAFDEKYMKPFLIYEYEKNRGEQGLEEAKEAVLQ